MAAIGILIGSANYQAEEQLPCCPRDVEAVASLLDATGRFDTIYKFVDRGAAELKRELRAALEPLVRIDELFFYFSGHGYAEEGEFYFCPIDFDRDRPNATGLSDSELMVLIRDVSPELTVQIIDACNSGTRLLKSSDDMFPGDKGGLKNLVRIAACGESESAITGSQLSPFTERFCLAAARPGDGPVYYTDIIGALRDEYRRNLDRTPQFVLQASARETFIDDTQQLAAFRAKLTADWGDLVDDSAVTTEHMPSAAIPTLAERLAALDERMVKKEDVPVYINRLFNGLLARLSREEFGDAFDLSVAEHKDFQEQTTRGFIIRTLSQEKRADEFVTAAILKHRKRRRNALVPDFGYLALGLATDDEITETWDLELNMKMERAQLRITLTPKYALLQRVVLVVSCAPSLERCYVFELATRHPRTDWDSFAVEGIEFTRRWYRESWTSDPSSLIEKIATTLVSGVQELIDQAVNHLSDDST